MRKPDEFLLTKVTTQIALLDKMDQVAEQRVSVAVNNVKNAFSLPSAKRHRSDSSLSSRQMPGSKWSRSPRAMHTENCVISREIIP